MRLVSKIALSFPLFFFLTRDYLADMPRHDLRSLCEDFEKEELTDDPESKGGVKLHSV